MRNIAKWRSVFRIGLSIPPSAPVEMTVDFAFNYSQDDSVFFANLI